ncbi:hypothetical protein DFQ26_005739 [Actinomortierella ambigua]|nr:hypothetical protein DFQ26_005739 [Actinomortierella ambigua]
MDTVIEYVSHAAKSSAMLKLLQKSATKGNATRAVGLYILYLVLYRYSNNSIGTRRRRDLPGPRGWPLLGNLIEMATLPFDQISQTHDLYYEKYGKVWTFTVPGLGRVLHVNDPDCLEHVLKTNFWAYEKGKVLQESLFDLLGNGVFAVDGHHWRWQRKLASHIFNVKAFRDYTNNVFVHESEIVCAYFDKMAEQGTVVDVHDIFLKFTLDSFGEVSFGQSFGCLDDPTKEVKFAVSFDRLNAQCGDRLFKGPWKLVERLNGDAKIVAFDRQVIQETALNIIRARRANGYDRKQKDLLQLFMEATDEDGQPLTDEMLMDSMLNFIIAGRDTTAQALSWMFYLMHRNQSDPQIKEKLTAEIDQVLGAKEDGVKPSYETYKQMRYAEACLYEALRLYPSVPRNMKQCVQDDVLPIGGKGVKIYKGEFFAWSPWTMGRAEAIWGPDAKMYKPDRWMTGDKNSATKFPAFHAGPRTCLGQQFATLEAVTLMAMLFQRFEFELVDPMNEPPYGPGLTLPVKHGLPVRVHRRDEPRAI